MAESQHHGMFHSEKDEQHKKDQEFLAKFGYKQELDRSLGFLSTFAIAFGFVSATNGFFALFYYGLDTGGPAGVFWSWPIVVFGQLMVALVFAEAASHYNAALVLDPLYADACSNLGKLTAELGAPDQGLALLRRAIGIEPRMVDAYLNAADLEGRRGRWPDALGWLEALRDFAPDHPKLVAGRAHALRQLGQSDDVPPDDNESPPQ